MWTNPWALVLIAFLAITFIGLNVMLVDAFRRRGDHSGLGMLLSGTEQARKRQKEQADQYAELARLVDELRGKESRSANPDGD